MFWYNRNYKFLCILILTILFYSCQKKNPYLFLSGKAASVGHISASVSKSITSFNQDVLMGKAIDSIGFFLKNMPQLKNHSDFDIYFCGLDNNFFTYIIKSEGLGEEIFNKVHLENGIPNFQYKEIYNEGGLFISPIDKDLVICSNKMEDIQSSIKRSEKNSILSNPVFSQIFEKADEKSTHWFVTFDSLSIQRALFPLHGMNINSAFIKHASNFAYLSFIKESGNSGVIEIQSKELEPSKLGGIESDFNTEKRQIDFGKISETNKVFKYSKMNFNINKHTFQIIIE